MAHQREREVDGGEGLEGKRGRRGGTRREDSVIPKQTPFFIIIKPLHSHSWSLTSPSLRLLRCHAVGLGNAASPGPWPRAGLPPLRMDRT